MKETEILSLLQEPRLLEATGPSVGFSNFTFGWNSFLRETQSEDGVCSSAVWRQGDLFPPRPWSLIISVSAVLKYFIFRKGFAKYIINVMCSQAHFEVNHSKVQKFMILSLQQNILNLDGINFTTAIKRSTQSGATRCFALRRLLILTTEYLSSLYPRGFKRNICFLGRVKTIMCNMAFFGISKRVLCHWRAD